MGGSRKLRLTWTIADKSDYAGYACDDYCRGRRKVSRIVHPHSGVGRWKKSGSHDRRARVTIPLRVLGGRAG